MNLPRPAYLQTIRDHLRDNPFVSLIGPRQAGKTTLARLLADRCRRILSITFGSWISAIIRVVPDVLGGSVGCALRNADFRI